jgi:hypothetical protein
MSKGVWQRVPVLGKLLKPGETESGSAGTQPDKEYPGLRCDKGAPGRWWSNPPSSHLCSYFGHRSHASQILLRNPWLGHDLERARFRRMNPKSKKICFCGEKVRASIECGYVSL